MREPSPLHRFPSTMGRLLHRAIARIRDRYGGDASRIWGGSPGSATVVLRFLKFDGVGPKIATMAANILVRDFRIPVSDRHSIDLSVDVHTRRVMTRLGLVRKGATQEEVIYTARALNPDYPGIFDLVLWEIGRKRCHPNRAPDCSGCPMSTFCPFRPGVRPSR